MVKNTKEENELIKNKLKYLELDLNNIPDEIKEFYPIEYKPPKVYDETKYKVYRYVDIRQIQILLTDKNRLDSLNERFKSASTISSYLEPENEDDIEKHTTFLKMLREVDINKIDELEKEQKEYLKEIPFKVKYTNNYLWQIFYDKYTQQYFMLVPTEDKNYEAFFYVLKNKIHSIKNKKAKKIYVPISYLDYNNEFLKKSEIEDLEKYLWLFTKEWPTVYEVYDKKDNLSIQIVGETNVYEKIKSIYKIEINNENDATKFYKLLKALFILQTELPHKYNFETKISSNGGLEFLYNNRIIEYESLTRVINEEYEKNKNELKELVKNINKEKEELENINKDTKNKEIEYLNKEKQIATYMECKKSFLGKVKYFFKYKKTKKQDNEEIKQEKKELKKEKEKIKIEIKQKEQYTIEDLIELCKENEEKNKKEKDIQLDKKAMNLKKESIERKLNNATKYIEEIENHKKSIFEFWKFCNKDEILELTEGENEQKVEKMEIQKTFDYVEDFEEFGNKIDKIQRELFSKKECDSIFIASTNILDDINNLINIDDINLENNLNILKKELKEQNKLYEQEEFDVFGSVVEDKTKIKNLGNKKHREIAKNKLQILNIKNNTNEEEYKESIKQILKDIQTALEKGKSINDISLYVSEKGKLNTNELKILHINPENAIEQVKYNEKINLYRINVKKDVNLIALSNIMYYDNKNKTLPLGMDISDEILLDLSKLKLELKRQNLFRMNQIVNNVNVNTKIICVYEYDIINEKES